MKLIKEAWVHVCVSGVGAIVGYIGFNPAVFNEGSNHLLLGCAAICPFGKRTKKVMSTGTSHIHTRTHVHSEYLEKCQKR